MIRIMKSRRMRWKGHVALMVEKRKAYRLLVGKPEGKRQLLRPRRGFVNNIRKDLVEVGWGDVEWIDLARDTKKRRSLVNSVLNLRVPLNAGKLSSGPTLVASRVVLSSKELVSCLVWKDPSLNLCPNDCRD
jgi:hypothetical protein